MRKGTWSISGTMERDRIGLLQGLTLSLLCVTGYLGSHSMKKEKLIVGKIYRRYIY